MERYDEITPVPGVDYTSAKAVRDAWHDGNDFILARTGQHMSVRDVPDGLPVQLRYAKLRKVTIVSNKR